MNNNIMKLRLPKRNIIEDRPNQDEEIDKNKPHGTTYQQSPILYVLKDRTSSNIVYSWGKTNICKFKNKAKPTIPLTLTPLKKESNKYYCGFVFNYKSNTYYNKIPIKNIQNNLLEDNNVNNHGILFIFLVLFL